MDVKKTQVLKDNKMQNVEPNQLDSGAGCDASDVEVIDNDIYGCEESTCSHEDNEQKTV